MKCSACFVIKPSFTVLAKVFLVATVLTILLYVIRMAAWTFHSTFIPYDTSNKIEHQLSSGSETVNVNTFKVNVVQFKLG